MAQPLGYRRDPDIGSPARLYMIPKGFSMVQATGGVPRGQPKSGRHHRYTPAIIKKSSALRLAPPTSAPETFSTANSSAAFFGLTEPP